ncbi:MAG: roadblock/LC7 domain-containing protein [Methanomicrobiaceae archaeon]|nr:roadblock/LC7 domain-containing protein [Methanomicrobiaceae archaeon]
MMPDGVSLGKMQIALQNLSVISPRFLGAARITGPGGEGMILLAEGDPVAARFTESETASALEGEDAYRHLLDKPFLECELLNYTQEEFQVARIICRSWGCLITRVAPRQEAAGMAATAAPMSEESLDLIKKQPGVIAVSVFHEGFALQSLGNADVEHVAAVAEDLLRAGMEITLDMEMGDLAQMILETPQGKFIIAPYGDLYICVLTAPDAHLGLIRLTLRNIQDGTQEA